MLADSRCARVPGAAPRTPRTETPPMHLSAQTHYQAELDAGRFCIQQCTQCTRHVFTPRELCPHCGASPLRWVRASGQGTVYSTSTVARKRDRKSTRLNSSHQIISYAVFCLKKKIPLQCPRVRSHGALNQ